MTSDEALAEIRGLAGANRIELSAHAEAEMRAANATRLDVQHALMTAAVCIAEPRERWKVPGRDIDGDALTVIVVIEDGLLVVTVY